jgi:diguanylate cyclase (GGDEF)-like protein/PAS domain S-box-containing protein
VEHFVNEIDGRILHGEPLDAILDAICRELISRGSYPLVQISLKGQAGAVEIRKVRGSAAAFLNDIDVRWDEVPNGCGPTGTAIRTGRVRVCDIERDAAFAPWRERALRFGLRSALAIPLAAHGKTLGALTLFSGQRGMRANRAHALKRMARRIARSIAAVAVQEKIRLQGVALDAAANAIVITNAAGVIQWVNPAFTRLTGWSSSEAIGQTPRLLRSGMHTTAFYRQLWTTLLGGQVWRGEMFNRRKDGEIYVEEQTVTPVRDERGTITHFVAIKQDVTQRKRQEQEIRHLALHDTLTQLPNRRAFDTTLDRVMWDAREGNSAAMLIADVDDFNLVNDTAGHLVGDEVLAALGSALRNLLRPGDFIGRFGGDEFAILLRSVDDCEAFAIAERLRHTAQELAVDAFHVSVSIGVAMIDATMDAKTIISNADAALYAAKERGRNRSVLFAQDVGLRLAEATEWLSKIRSALRDNRLLLTFQPVVRLGSGEAEHFEALIRMTDGPNIILPDRFLPVAERYGLMPQIDRWVFDEVVRILEGRPSLRIFANLSGASLNDAELLSYIENRLRSCRVPPGRLAFEITESAAVSDLASARNWIRRLKELGCLFALDDFGVGFSSLGYLRALAVDYVKIDRTFIRDVDTNPTNRALVQAVKSVAHTLGKEVIAEGVESAAHAAVLRELGIEHGQGFHWGGPEPEIPELLAVN